MRKRDWEIRLEYKRVLEKRENDKDSRNTRIRRIINGESRNIW